MNGSIMPTDDVNESVTRQWISESSPRDRVREVIQHCYSPVTPETIGENAHTETETARDHLIALVEDGYAVETPDGYRRSPESLISEQAADILENVSRDEIEQRVSELRDCDEMDVTTKRNLAFMRAALDQSDG